MSTLSNSKHLFYSQGYEFAATNDGRYLQIESRLDNAFYIVSLDTVSNYAIFKGYTAHELGFKYKTIYRIHFVSSAGHSSYADFDTLKRAQSFKIPEGYNFDRQEIRQKWYK